VDGRVVSSDVVRETHHWLCVSVTAISPRAAHNNGCCPKLLKPRDVCGVSQAVARVLSDRNLEQLLMNAAKYSSWDRISFVYAGARF
jgi:hypothetical protein